MQAPKLPNLDEWPSVLEFDQINTILSAVLHACTRNPSITANDAVDCMVDTILAQAYRPDEQIDPNVLQCVFQWIKATWDSADSDYADAACTVLANLGCDGVQEYVRRLLSTESRKDVLKSLTLLDRELRTGRGALGWELE